MSSIDSIGDRFVFNGCFRMGAREYPDWKSRGNRTPLSLLPSRVFPLLSKTLLCSCLSAGLYCYSRFSARSLERARAPLRRRRIASVSRRISSLAMLFFVCALAARCRRICAVRTYTFARIHLLSYFALYIRVLSKFTEISATVRAHINFFVFYNDARVIAILLSSRRVYSNEYSARFPHSSQFPLNKRDSISP